MAQRHVAVGGGVGCRLEQWGVDDPREGPVAFLDEAELLRDGLAGSAQQRAGGLGIAGGEEDGVARLGANVFGDAVALSIGDVLGHRAAQGAVLGDGDVRQPLGAALLRPLLPGVELTARLGGTALHDHGADVFLLEDAEGRVLEEVSALGDLDVEAQIRLIRAVVLHGVGVGHARDRRGDLVADELPQLDQDFLGELDDVLLVHEGHLDVQLGKFRLAVSSEVLIAVAARNLVVALHAGDHEQLLEQLRRLRQGVPGARL